MHKICKFFVFFIVNQFCIFSHQIDENTFKVLDDCAQQNTSFLQGKISEEAIERFRNYCSKTFSYANSFPVSLFSFTQPNEPNTQGSWSVESISPGRNNPSFINIINPRTQKMLAWLKKNYTPSSNFKFFHLPAEPYLKGWTMPKKTQDELAELLSSCPLLISCTHPDLAWTKRAILIPDSFILNDEFHANMYNLLNSKVDESTDDSKENSQNILLPFSQRKSIIYFRGGLGGPKFPFTMENIQENPRQYILTLLKDLPYLDIGITKFSSCFFNNKPYKKYIYENFWQLKSPRTNFFEHGKNKYLLSCDGHGAAWSRIQLIMATGSVLFLNAQCEQYFYPLMENYKTHIVINKNFSNLDAEFQRLENAPEVAEKIGNQGREFARKFFTKEAIDTYLWLVLNKLECNKLPAERN